MSQPKPSIATRKITKLDQLVQILEISFIFLLTFSIIALLDTVMNELDLYRGISNDFLGKERVGPLNGGNFEAIVRITLIFNLLLFTFSLFFGLWIRRTRDNWTLSQMGYSLNTPGYSFFDLIRRGFLLGLISILIFYVARSLIFFLEPGWNVYHAFAYSTAPDTLYTTKELNAEYYFGIVEMGFIWPLSAGFFFFAYAYNSLKARFPTGIANVLATFFYVFYLQFFFLIDSPDKINQFQMRILDPVGYRNFWFISIALWLILYINFSAFAETKSIVLPFLMNFVFNVGITLIQAGNTLLYTHVNMLMLIPVVLIFLIVLIWLIMKPSDFSTIKLGVKQIRDFSKINILHLLGFVILFIFLSFFLPGWINEILYLSNSGIITLQNWQIPVLYALNFVLLIVLAVIILTYEPTDVFDVLLVSKDGIPLASHIRLFETDDILISGFFTALAAVDQELSADSGLKSIKRGQREILIEEGVFSRVIALADRDQPSIRQSIVNMHREFEIKEGKLGAGGTIQQNNDHARKLVEDIGNLSIRFSIPQQTRWIGIISLILAPTMIILIGLI